jgi:hypothetical protein
MAALETGMLLENNNELAAEALSILKKCMPGIENSLKGEEFKLSEPVTGQIKTFASHLAGHGSPLLKKIIIRFLEDLENGRLLSSLKYIPAAKQQ